MDLPLTLWSQLIFEGKTGTVQEAISECGRTLNPDEITYLLCFINSFSFDYEFIRSMLAMGGILDEKVIPHITPDKLIDAIIEARMARDIAQCEEDFRIVCRLDQCVLAIELMQEHFEARLHVANNY